MTTHHESGTEQVSSFERMEQLKLCFKRMIDAPPHRIVLFGGDLNMREREVRINQILFININSVFFIVTNSR